MVGKNLNVRYREDLPLVIKKLSFEINPGEKIGVVGPSGSGKSTLLLIITKILEMDQIEGSELLIDDQDVSKMNLT